MGKFNCILVLVLFLTTACAPIGRAAGSASSNSTSITPPPPDTTETPETTEGPAELPADPLQVPQNAGQQNDGSLKSGNKIASLSYLPQLDEIGFWQTYQEFRKYDLAPVKIAILDGNFNTKHPDLVGSISATYNFFDSSCGSSIGAVNTANCLNVFKDPATADLSTDKLLGEFDHGTIIAGVIAGRGVYGKGVIGVNPSAKLILLRISTTSANNIARALQGAIDSGADIISLSFGIGDKGTADVASIKALFQTAVQKGILVVVAAGNGGNDGGGGIDVNSEGVFPTRYADLAGMIAVGATNQSQIASYSNYGTNYVCQSAPGRVASSGGDYKSNLYSYAQGTSFSGPMVAAAASRVIQYLKSKAYSYTPSDIENILNAGAYKNSSLVSKFKDGNELDMPSLLKYLKSHYP